MDRHGKGGYLESTEIVAPLAGSVDRNFIPATGKRWMNGVAPLAGSVDRNNYANYAQALARMSLPSRGAWIEIPH